MRRPSAAIALESRPPDSSTLTGTSAASCPVTASFSNSRTRATVAGRSSPCSTGVNDQ
ncbi:hypothetical protein OHB41_02350 [Streptomyces sp. NBC_01571]|nr:hypothetical protein [Streptomyces sp. NBC_01571]MCX4572044.1 hypothetical protein [Streptomyces sp. NBC_01571]